MNNHEILQVAKPGSSFEVFDIKSNFSPSILEGNYCFSWF